MNARWCAIVLLFCAGTAMSADLRRLFFTPAQRAALDNLRQQSIRGEVVIEHKQAAPPPPQNVSVSGLVRRSDGKSTVWLNDRPISERSAGGINAQANKTDDGVKLSVPGTGRSVDLKVGQSVEILSGTIEEGYARRTVPPPKPAPNAASGSQTTTPDAGKATVPPASPPEGSDAEKTTPPRASGSASSDAASPIRATRARARQMQDDARTDGAGDRK